MIEVGDKIGGYGEFGDCNWGFDSSELETKKWFEECQKHIGEKILLAGGGSLGKVWLAKLVSATKVMLGDSPVVQVRLEDIEPVWSIYSKNIFEPYLGSWQLFTTKEDKNGTR